MTSTLRVFFLTMGSGLSSFVVSSQSKAFALLSSVFTGYHPSLITIGTELNLLCMHVDFIIMRFNAEVEHNSSTNLTKMSLHRLNPWHFENFRSVVVSPICYVIMWSRIGWHSVPIGGGHGLICTGVLINLQLGWLLLKEWIFQSHWVALGLLYMVFKLMGHHMGMGYWWRKWIAIKCMGVLIDLQLGWLILKGWIFQSRWVALVLLY